MSRADIRSAIEVFVGDDLEPQFWAYYADYDWVVFCQLWGIMINLPEHFPKYCMDLKQAAIHLGRPELPKQSGTEHDALADARWNRDVWHFLEDKNFITDTGMHM